MLHHQNIKSKHKVRHVHVVKVNAKTKKILFNLAQAYEAEFSTLTRKFPDKFGRFSLDVIPRGSHVGYLLYYKKIPVGFCVIDVKSKVRDIAEFYILPIMRKSKLGYLFAATIFDTYPGEWQARQIQGAEHARKFCRYVIKKYTNNHFTEEVVNDRYWGKITKQRFVA